LEAFSSERAIISNCISELNNGKADTLRHICGNAESPTIHEIIKAQSEGDQSVNAILEDAVYHMGIGIANIDNFVRPKCILIDSNIFQNQKNKDQLMDVIMRNLYTATDIDTKFIFVEPDIYSGAIGAAAAAVQNDLKTFIE
ncbi:ROK family protein, partial [Weissella cibaria]